MLGEDALKNFKESCVQHRNPYATNIIVRDIKEGDEKGSM
jgi:hypothetical protein